MCWPFFRKYFILPDSMKINRNHRSYVRGKASKVVTGQFHLVIFNNYLGGCIEKNVAFRVMMLSKPRKVAGEISYVVNGWRGRALKKSCYIFRQPGMMNEDGILEVIPLNNVHFQEEADHVGEYMFYLFNRCYTLGLTREMYR